MNTQSQQITVTRVNNDMYGNPRHVVHFLNIADTYPQALAKSRQFGGRKFHNKQYGGGILFYADADRVREIVAKLNNQ